VDNAKLYEPQKMKYFLVIDQGTSSTRAILFDEKFAVVNVSQTEFKQFFPKDGWVEHDANEIFDTVVSCIKDVMEKSETTHKEIIAIGITNQRETCLLWDKKGNPLGKAIVWQDRRTAELCNKFKREIQFEEEKSKDEFEIKDPEINKMIEDLQLTLQSLNYKDKEIKTILPIIFKEVDFLSKNENNLSFENLLKLAMNYLDKESSNIAS